MSHLQSPVDSIDEINVLKIFRRHFETVLIGVMLQVWITGLKCIIKTSGKVGGCVYLLGASMSYVVGLLVSLYFAVCCIRHNFHVPDGCFAAPARHKIVDVSYAMYL